MKRMFLAFLFACPIVALGSVVCPDGSYCNDGNTCCAVQEGGYGCCPMPSAVCCSSDKCCPEGNICLTIFGLCIGGSTESRIYLSRSLSKTPSMPPPSVKDIPCPGGWSCPETGTCCAVGCCPYRDATCCNNTTHCCPDGYECDVAAGQCVQDRANKLPVYTNIELFDKNYMSSQVMMKAYPFSEERVICPGDKYFCPDGNTCCSSTSSEWDCCPLPDAVCCSDHGTCCPEGYKCDSEGQTCLKSKSPAAIEENISAKSTEDLKYENAA